MRPLAQSLSLFLTFILISNSIFGQNEAIQKGLDAINKESVQAQLEFLSQTGWKAELQARKVSLWLPII